jgi:hypothetical protein
MYASSRTNDSYPNRKPILKSPHSTSSENTAFIDNKAVPLDSKELASQFTNFLNNLEKLSIENNELVSRNNELLKKNETQEKALNDYLFLANSLGKINTVFEQVQNWLSSASSQARPITKTHSKNPVCFEKQLKIESKSSLVKLYRFQSSQQRILCVEMIT